MDNAQKRITAKGCRKGGAGRTGRAGSVWLHVALTMWRLLLSMTAQIKCNKACCKRARMKINSDSSSCKYYIFMPALYFQKISQYIGPYVLATHIRAGQLLPVHRVVGVGVGVGVGMGVCCNNNNRNDKAATSATIATATSERCSNNINTGSGNGQRQEWGCNMGCPATSCHVYHPSPL